MTNNIKMDGISLVGYTRIYPHIDLELKKDERMYDMVILSLRIDEFKGGMKVSKVYKTTKQGTKVKFEMFKNDAEIKEYYNELMTMIERYKAKYGESNECSTYTD